MSADGNQIAFLKLAVNPGFLLMRNHDQSLTDYVSSLCTGNMQSAGQNSVEPERGCGEFLHDAVRQGENRGL